jgi:hypothetical protein
MSAPVTGWLDLRQFVRSIFGNVRELVVIRDPRDVFCSHLAYFHSDQQQSFQEISEACFNLLEIYNSGSKDTLFVSYERMILDQQQTFQSVANYLGVELPMPADSTRDDSIFKEHATTDSPQSSIARWRRDLSDDQKKRCGEAWRTFLETFGYAEEASDDPAHTASGAPAADRGPDP